jgi:DNA-binding MurR/RpiR family transcriptional regulator
LSNVKLDFRLFLTLDTITLIQAIPLEQIRAKLGELSTAERRVGEFVLENAQLVATSAIADTAHAVGVSEATIVRFCRSVGYKGYLDFRFALTQMLADPLRSLHAEIQPDDNIGKIAERTIYSAIASLRDTLNEIDVSALEHAVKVASIAPYVMIIGVGTSAPFAVDLYHKLVRLGLPCEVIVDPYVQLLKVALMRPGSLVIAVTHSGASAEPVNTFRAARERGIQTLAITGTVPSPITQYADMVLRYTAHETRLEPVIGRIAQLAMCDVFFLALAKQDVLRSEENERKIWELVITHVVAD